MVDHRLLQLASEAENMAHLCERMETALKAVDIRIDSEIGRLLASHQGETPEQLRANYREWKDYILESFPSLDAVIARCYNQAETWRADYARQSAAETNSD